MLDLKELKRVREKMKISTEEMADILGLKSRSSYWRFETREIKKVDLNRLPIIADKLELTNNQILKIFFGRDVAEKETINK